jgi:hypothetical protein
MDIVGGYAMGEGRSLPEKTSAEGARNSIDLRPEKLRREARVLLLYEAAGRRRKTHTCRKL